MKSKNRMINNFIYQFSYQLLILVVPLVISPYLTRTLTGSSLGEYTYVNSIAYYFVLLAMLGISRYGQRLIAQSRENTALLQKRFWSLFYAHIISSALSFLLYIIFIACLNKIGNTIYLFQMFYVLSALFDITWLFYGIENFKNIVIKNTIIRICECVLIVTLVKSPDDVGIYTLITSLSVLFGQMIMIPQAIKFVPPVKVAWKEIQVHFKPLLAFSISVIAVSLYTVFDKILLGIMTEKQNVAYYEYANKIVSIPKTIITVIGTVMYPRACNLSSKGDYDGQKKFMRYSFIFTAIIGIGTAFGLLSIADDFACYYYGSNFEKSGHIMMSMALLPYIVGMGDVIRTQYMIPNHMDKAFNLCIVLNAIINIIISVMLIPFIGIYGAVAGTTCAELFGLIFQLYICRDKIKIGDILEKTFPFVIFGILMFLIIKIVGRVMKSNITSFFVQMVVGGVFYTMLSIIYLYKKEKINIFYMIKNGSL